jgi:hypothetical protein
MKTTLTTIIMLLSLWGNTQTFNSEPYQRKPNDTIHVIYLLSDTSIIHEEGFNAPNKWMAEWQQGYVVIEHHNTLENFNPPVSKIDSQLSGHDYEKQYYLDYTKNRFLDKKYIVWNWVNHINP